MRTAAVRFVICFCLAAAAAPAVRAADDDVVSKMSAGRVERIVQSFRETKDLKELDDGAYSFQVDGLKIIIFNKGETMQLAAVFTQKVSLSRINEWNRTKRFAKAYSDEKGRSVLESDLELTGGVTEKNVKEWMKTYVASLKAFQKHLEGDE